MQNGPDGSVCQKCETHIADLAEALLNGCPSCKHRRFKFIKKSSKQTNGLKHSLETLFNQNEESESVGVGIQIVDRGTFKIVETIPAVASLARVIASSSDKPCSINDL